MNLPEKLLLIIVISLCSCASGREIPYWSNNNYIGKTNKSKFDINFIFIINIQDTTGSLDVIKIQKDIPDSYNIFTQKEIIPETMQFHLSKEKNDFQIFFNLTDTFKLNVKTGRLVLFRKEQKSEEFLLINLTKVPSKNLLLYNYCFQNPNDILEQNGIDNYRFMSYVGNRLISGFNYNHDKMEFNEFYSLLKDSIIKYKQDFDKQNEIH